MKRQECRGCAAPIVWAISERSGSAVPVDAEPTARGNIDLLPRKNLPPLARFASKKLTIPAGAPLYISHFATCPRADLFRHGNRREEPIP